MANLFQKIKQWFPEWKKESPLTPAIGTSSTDGGGLQNIVIKEIQQGEISPNVTYNFTDLTDTPKSYAGQTGLVCTVNATETGLEFAAGGGGASTFLDLTDTPDSYAGQTGQFVKVKAAEDGLEFGAGAGGILGGLYGINVLNMVGNVTLTPNVDKIYQYLNPNGSTTRTVTLATVGATAADRFIIKNTSGYVAGSRPLTIKQGATTIEIIYPGGFKNYIFDGTNWMNVSVETAPNALGTIGGGIMIGYAASAKSPNVGMGVAIGGSSFASGAGTGSAGVAIGSSAGASSGDNVAIGNSAVAYGYGVAVGDASDSGVAGMYNYATALGYWAKNVGDYGLCIGTYANNTKAGSIALGNAAKTNRICEIARAIDSANTNSGNTITIGGWKKQTTNNTPVEMFLAAVSSARFTIIAQSVLLFNLLIAARDNVGNAVAAYQVQGLIKRDNANNTILSWSSKTVLYEDDATWDVAVTADDTNEALVITVTGDDTNPTNWVARLDGVETRF
jgi:hypothetical protein